MTPATIKVDSTYQADISAEITGTGSISKRGLGTLILSHDNSYTGGTVLKEGTLVANTRNALSSGSVTLEGGLLASVTPTHCRLEVTPRIKTLPWLYELTAQRTTISWW